MTLAPPRQFILKFATRGGRVHFAGYLPTVFAANHSQILLNTITYKNDSGNYLRYPAIPSKFREFLGEKHAIQVDFQNVF